MKIRKIESLVVLKTLVTLLSRNQEQELTCLDLTQPVPPQSIESVEQKVMITRNYNVPSNLAITYLRLKRYMRQNQDKNTL